MHMFLAAINYISGTRSDPSTWRLVFLLKWWLRRHQSAISRWCARVRNEVDDERHVCVLSTVIRTDWLTESLIDWQHGQGAGLHLVHHEYSEWNLSFYPCFPEKSIRPGLILQDLILCESICRSIQIYDKINETKYFVRPQKTVLVAVNTEQRVFHKR